MSGDSKSSKEEGSDALYESVREHLEEMSDSKYGSDLFGGDGPPTAKALEEGYNQTYVILSSCEGDAKASDGNEVFFRCGNWCYKGLIQFADLLLGTEQLPLIIPMLQKQQGSLRYFCNAKAIPPQSSYSEPVRFLHDAAEFIASEILSESVDKELKKMASVFSWIDDDSAATYFELGLANLPEYMKRVELMASKTYVRGLVIICIYCSENIYFVVQPGEGDQPLLDVRFPDVSKHGQGLHIDSYHDHCMPYRKLTLWHNLAREVQITMKEIPKIRTLNVASKNYEQTYIILKSSWDANSEQLAVHHDVLFRFGSWCYSGRVQLTPALTLVDIPFVIPALRMQQSRLDYLCDVSSVPTTSPFAGSLGYVQETTPLLEAYIHESEGALKSLIERLTDMGLGDSVSKWLEGDPNNSFFEFKLQGDTELESKFRNVELVVSKSYHASGIITVIIIFQQTIYVALQESSGESPLLDSRFPDVSGKGRGYQLQAYSSGTPSWPQLRKVSIWQTVSALEQEFREKAQELAQSKTDSSAAVLEDNKGAVTDDQPVVAAAAVATAGSKSAEPEPETEVPTSRAEAKAAATLQMSSKDTSHRLSVVDIARSPVKGEAMDGSSKKVFSPSTGTASASSIANIAPSKGAMKQALPYHVPKMEALSSKLDDIRKTLGDGGLKAPWDMKGKPLGGLGSKQPLGSIGGTAGASDGAKHGH